MYKALLYDEHLPMKRSQHGHILRWLEAEVARVWGTSSKVSRLFALGSINYARVLPSLQVRRCQPRPIAASHRHGCRFGNCKPARASRRAWQGWPSASFGPRLQSRDDEHL